MTMLTTVNGGKIIEFEDSKVEVLGPNYSSHRMNMVAGYLRDGTVKVEVCLHKYGVSIYRFKTYTDLQHYWSKNYTIYDITSSKGMNQKYGNMLQYLIRAYRHIFGTELQ